MNADIQFVCELARKAGKRILEIYNRNDFEIEHKEDNSPLTTADRASHEFIASGLAERFPDIPILSEEGKSIPFEKRRGWSRFWVVDPLDGTKEFIKRNGEFTVNIALVEGGPVLGVIYAPVPGILYYAFSDGAFRQQNQSEQPIRVAGDPQSDIIAVRSRSHASPEEEAYARKVGCTEIISAGSSLKFCRVAEGKAHFYYRHGPTMEWDTAAGHAIVAAAGGYVTGLKYNKPELRNGPFLVRCSEQLPGIQIGQD
jgi:3'(2'), 5'-bisphosphate nucleotidase